MKGKIILIMAILAILLSVCAVSADENVTDDAVLDEPLQDTDITVEEPPVKSNSTITAQKTVGYERFTTKFTVNLTSGGVKLPSKKVSITINGTTYKRTTDENGQAHVNVKLANGKYKATFSFDGDDNFTSSKNSTKITVKLPLKTKIKCADKDINYRQGSKCAVIVRLLDENGKAVKNQNVTFKVNGKTYIAKTDYKGYAKIFVNLKKGKYKVTYRFSRNAPYLTTSGSHKIKVKEALGKGNGYWLWSAHMNSVNLKNLAKKGTKQIFLHVHSIYLHGKSAVVSFIKRAHHYGMKVHLWMQVFYSGGKWVCPVKPDGSYRIGFMNNKIALAKQYAKIKGVDGIHFDYVRFGGTAHLYNTSTAAVNYFIKKATLAIHSVRPNCIISAAIMPEPSAMHYYYGQDVPEMSKYIDVLLPMVYKGNYGKNTAWIKSVTKTFVSQSNGAQVWTGLQAYLSDSNAKKLTQSELVKDARAAKEGGAKGVILFRIGVSCIFNFKKV